MRLATVVLAMLLASIPLALPGQSLEKGLAAAQAGDFETALREWRPLAENGSQRAQYNLGKMYSEGAGVQKDLKEAARWYRLAADQGFAPAQWVLGTMYFEGSGVAQDQAEAARWLHKAAQDGFFASLYDLGFMYAYGDGVPQDTVAAHMWFNLVATHGVVDPFLDGETIAFARNNRDKLERMMSQEQIGEAVRHAEACFQGDFQDCIDLSSATSNIPRRFQSIPFGWSTLVPADWQVDASDRAFVSMHPKGKLATCGMHVAETRFLSSDELADFLQRYTADLLKDEQGLTSRTTYRENISLQTGQDCIRITTELEPGGRSVRLYCRTSDFSFVMDCEASVLFWDWFSETFTSLHSSLQIE